MKIAEPHKKGPQGLRTQEAQAQGEKTVLVAQAASQAPVIAEFCNKIGT